MGCEPWQGQCETYAGGDPAEVVTKMFAEIARLRAEVGRLREWKAREQQAAIAIACRCVETGALSGSGTEGTVEAVELVCKELERLRGEVSRLERACQLAWPIVTDAILHGMPVTQGVADARNLLAEITAGLNAGDATTTATHGEGETR